MGSKLIKSRESDSNKRHGGGEATDGLLVQCTPNEKKNNLAKRSPTDGVVLQICVLFGGRVYTGILHGLQGGKDFVSGVGRGREQQ